MLNSRGFTHGPNLREEHHHKAKDALHGCSKKKRTKTSICDRWQNDQTYRESQVAIGWSDAWVRYLDHIAQIDISHNATQEQRIRYHNLVYLRSVDEDRQAPQLGTSLGYCEAKHALVAVQKHSRQELGITFIIKCERHRSGNQLDPQLQGYHEWQRTNWAEYFTKEREPPTSSSSSEWSSTSLWSWHSLS